MDFIDWNIICKLSIKENKYHQISKFKIKLIMYNSKKNIFHIADIKFTANLTDKWI